MEQRPLRLGDILDDYCPRERRVTNHAVVAMIEEDVKQTRCTTCDAEHVYKGGKAPRRKKADTTGALYKEVLAGITDSDAAPAAASAVAGCDEPRAADSDDAGRPRSWSSPRPIADSGTIAQRRRDIDDDSQIHMLPRSTKGPVHRPLIRAQLPRPEGIKIERQAPEFTIRQNNGRGGPRRPRRRGDSGRGGGGGGGDRRRRRHGQRFGRGPSQPRRRRWRRTRRRPEPGLRPRSRRRRRTSSARADRRKRSR